MQQQMLAGFGTYAKTTRWAKCLADEDRVVPWCELAIVVEPHYPKVSPEGGRPPVELERMLRICCLRLWFDLSDAAVEEPLYESVAMPAFVGVDLGSEAAPDETMACELRHLLAHQVRQAAAGGGDRAPEASGYQDRERHDCGCDDHQRADFAEERGPGARSRDAPDCEVQAVVLWDEGARGDGRQGKAGRHSSRIGANIPDKIALPDLMHGREARVYGGQGCHGQTDVIREVVPNAHDFTNRKCRFSRGPMDEIVKAKNRTKSKVRAKVEHVIGVIKRVVGFQRTRYRGLAENLHRRDVMAGLTSVFMQRQRLLVR